ncbi:TetR/AcrR family transcriptional regulator [Nocardia jinanensis]|uniref:TetR family transcriptional regulator n=1 Tax=Nocardia jinanensis TaxID=382504 RepID=A0A917VTU8_9NOCA|nr:TetR/AcrR family transcriptional regulator [Nocardia jinanensis]GGL13974.1 TetR family transcriptional regulator [Nocardia jinanensis]
MTGYIDKRSAPGPSVTRADVFDAALTLFAERGYHGTSLKQVAERLDIRTPSLYNHMESKSSLLKEIVLGTLDRVVGDFDRVIAEIDSPVERLRAATEVYALHHATHPREALVVNQDSTSLDEPERTTAQQIRRRHEREFRQIIIDGQEAGVFTVENPKLASFAIREMSVSIARWFHEGGALTAEEVARQYSEYALSMVGARQTPTARRGRARKPAATR